MGLALKKGALVDTYDTAEAWRVLSRWGLLSCASVVAMGRNRCQVRGNEGHLEQV